MYAITQMNYCVTKKLSQLATVTPAQIKINICNNNSKQRKKNCQTICSNNAKHEYLKKRHIIYARNKSEKMRGTYSWFIYKCVNTYLQKMMTYSALVNRVDMECGFQLLMKTLHRSVGCKMLTCSMYL